MQRRSLLLFVCLLAACSRSKTPAAPPFEASRFITQNLRTSLSNADLGAMAAKRGRLPETRQFGDAMHRDETTMLVALNALARQRNIPAPPVIDQKKAALKENLQILPGQVFDRTYALAMVQDLGDCIKAFDGALAARSDADVQEFVRRYRPIVVARQQDANALLQRLGGSPFAVAR